jgi:hypothetical protein
LQPFDNKAADWPRRAKLLLRSYFFTDSRLKQCGFADVLPTRVQLYKEITDAGKIIPAKSTNNRVRSCTGEILPAHLAIL